LGGTVVVVLTVAVGAGGSSCRQIVGIPDTVSADACGLPYGANACASCVRMPTMRRYVVSGAVTIVALVPTP
jgi:hypothetical protein